MFAMIPNSFVRKLKTIVKSIIKGRTPNVPPTHHAALHQLADEGSDREWRQLAMYTEVMLKIKDIPGDIFEFGVASGTSFKCFVRLNSILEEEGNSVQRRKFYGFDSFEGLPELAKFDLASDGWHQPPEMKKGGFSSIGELEGLRAFCKSHENVELVPGWFSETVPTFIQKNHHTAAALVHIDCDLYESTRDSLGPVISRIPPGGVILFDEIFHPMFPGETSAFWEIFNASELPGKFVFRRVMSMRWKWYLERIS